MPSTAVTKPTLSNNRPSLQLCCTILEFHLSLRVNCSCSVSTYWLVMPPINRSCGVSNGGGLCNVSPCDVSQAYGDALAVFRRWGGPYASAVLTVFRRTGDLSAASLQLLLRCFEGGPREVRSNSGPYYFFVADHHDEWDAFARPIPKGRQGFRSSLQSHLQRRSRKIKKKIEKKTKRSIATSTAVGWK